ALGPALQSAREPVFYGIGVLWDAPFFLATVGVILAFPSGALRGRLDRAIILAAATLVAATFVPARLISEQISGAGPIAACRGAPCRRNRRAGPVALDARRSAIVDRLGLPCSIAEGRDLRGPCAREDRRAVAGPPHDRRGRAVATSGSRRSASPPGIPHPVGP